MREWWGRYTDRMWRRADYTDPLLDVRWVDCDEMLQSWDFTFKDTKTADFVVGQVWARRGANVYLVDQVRRRMSFTESVEAMRAMSVRWPQATAKLVEDKANGPAIISTLRDEIGGIIPVEPQGSKTARASAVSPYVAAGNAVIPATSGIIDGFDPDEFLNEMAQFPNGTHDDQVDAMSQALSRLYINGLAAWIDFIREQASGIAPVKSDEQLAREADELAVAVAVEAAKTDEERRNDARQAAFAASQRR